MSDPRSVLLIGAGGLVGRHLLPALSDLAVTPTYHSDTPDRGTQLDITDHDAVRRTIHEVRPDVIVLAAADAYVERCEREPEATRLVNVEAPRVIAAEAETIGAMLVVFSSDYVFDGTAGDYTEDDERRPINEYGRQKVELEDLALATSRGLVCRTSGVFGEDPRRKNFVYQLVDRLRAGQTFDVPSDQLITPTYAPALADAVVALLRLGHRGTVHVAGPRVMGRVEFARLIAETYALPDELLRARPTAELGLAAPRPLRCGLDVKRLHGILGSDLTAPDVALRELAVSGAA
jgi:dTDP-4-dehydrorhamnose reductase